MRLASLDLGTNSLLVTVADWDGASLVSVFENALLVRLGEHLRPGGKLDRAARSRCFHALESIREIIAGYDVDQVVAVATEAIRTASDGPSFIEVIRNRLGFPFRILTPGEEARLMFKATQKEFAHVKTGLVIFDIGGGSTEIVAGDALTVSQVIPLDFGTVSLTERFIRHDPIAPEEMDRALRWVQSRLTPLSPGPSPCTAVGTGGTVTTLKAVSLKMEPYDPPAIHRSTLTRTEVKGLLDLFMSMTVIQRTKLPGLPARRADIIPAGAAITGEIMDRLKLTAITVSDRGLRWGVLYDWIEKNG